MTYSIYFTASSKADAQTQVTTQLADALAAGKATQVEHDANLAVITALLGEASEPAEGMDLRVSVGVSDGGYMEGGNFQVTGKGMSASVTAMPVGS